jgi:hypothetical protein
LAAAGRAKYLDLAVALRRVDLDRLRRDPLVVLGHDLGLGEPRVEHVEQHRRRDAADGELAGALEEAAAIDVAVNILVEQIQQLLIEVARLHALHGAPPVARRISATRRTRNRSRRHSGSIARISSCEHVWRLTRNDREEHGRSRRA